MTKRLYKLEKGPCIYICENNIEQNKIGYSPNINKSMKNFTKLKFILYCNDSVEFKQVIKLRFDEDLILLNGEFIIPELPFDEIKNSILKIAEILNLEYTTIEDEELVKFNENKVKN